MTFGQACHFVAVNHGLGTTLVTGHKASYFQEAAELYARSKWEEACTAQRISCKKAFMEQSKKDEYNLSNVFYAIQSAEMPEFKP